MDLLPKIGGVDPYQGGAQQRPGTGAFKRKPRHTAGGRGAGDGQEDDVVQADLGMDPLLAEIDRIRALDPDLTESGAHRALMAVRAYQQTPGEPLDPGRLLAEGGLPAADAAAHVAEPAPAATPPTPPAASTGSDGQSP